MRNKIIAAAAVAAASFIATAATAADFQVYSSSELTSSMGGFVKTFGTKSAAKAAQDEINSDPETLAAIQAQGVQIKNVILARKAFDGSTIYYIK